MPGACAPSRLDGAIRYRLLPFLAKVPDRSADALLALYQLLIRRTCDSPPRRGVLVASLRGILIASAIRDLDCLCYVGSIPFATSPPLRLPLPNRPSLRARTCFTSRLSSLDIEISSGPTDVRIFERVEVSKMECSYLPSPMRAYGSYLSTIPIAHSA